MGKTSEASELVAQLLQKDDSERIPISEVKSSEFFSKIDFGEILLKMTPPPYSLGKMSPGDTHRFDDFETTISDFTSQAGAATLFEDW